MNNSVFWKTIENIRKRQNVTLIDDGKQAIKLSSKLNFDRATIFHETFIAVQYEKDRSFFLSQAILDLSKTLMFDCHYNYIREKYGSKAKLLFTDTDSLMHAIKTRFLQGYI